MLPCILFEDEHLLVVNKPAGWNTHAPSPFAGEGIYDWLRHREPRWSSLAIIHRLDKDTSGVMVFAKTTLANRSLTEQFTKRLVRKKYLLLTDRSVREKEFRIKTSLVRAGERYVSRSSHKGGDVAETNFRALETDCAGQTLLEAEPLTGRTHQIRVHSAENGFPIIGDILYGGVPSQRICLHAKQIRLEHPASHKNLEFSVEVNFNKDSRDALRESFIEPALTNAYRINHGSSDGPSLKGWFVDRLGDYLLSSSEAELHAESVKGILEWWKKCFGIRGAYHKKLNHQIRGASLHAASPKLIFGKAAPEKIFIRENGLQFELSFMEGYSVGLFLDQRDNRRRILTGHVAAEFPLFPSPRAPRPAPEVLNTFAYTCGFSVCAAKAGMKTTSLDLSKKYLDWGKRNFELNGLNPAEHDFIFGDVFDWLKRLQKKQRAFDVILLDPPTFSRSKEFGVFQVEKDFGKLAKAALPLLKTHGVLFASSNAATWPSEKFLTNVRNAVTSAKRKVLQEKYFPQPPDFPISRDEPGYLKTVWVRVA